MCPAPCHHSHFGPPLNRELAVENNDHPLAGVQGHDGLLQQEFLHIPLQRQVDSALGRQRRHLFPPLSPISFSAGTQGRCPQASPTSTITPCTGTPSPSSFQLGIDPLAGQLGTFQGAAPPHWAAQYPSWGAAQQLVVGSAPLRMGGVRTLPLLPAPGAQGGSDLDVAPLVLVGVPAVRDDAALDEAAEVPRQHRRQLQGERVTKGRGQGGSRQAAPRGGWGGAAALLPCQERCTSGPGPSPPPSAGGEAGTDRRWGHPHPRDTSRGWHLSPQPRSPRVASCAPVGGEGADRRGCGTRMDQRSSDGAPHPPQGLQAGKSQPQSPVSPSKGHQLALGSHSSAGLQ